MERILFKAKDKDQKWIYGLINEIDDKLYINNTECCEETICQFTTYTDKLKKKIFTHDRVKIDIGGLIYFGVVLFKDGRVIIDWDENAVNNYFQRVDLAFWKQFITVVGNEYE